MISHMQPNKPSLKYRSDFDEHKWIAQVRQSIDEEELEEEDDSNPVCIFRVPKILLFRSPDFYIPQQVSIGPYHYLRDELYEMERCKLSAAKTARKKSKSLSFEHLVEQLAELETKIRACYHNFLDFEGETLAWMMAIDACFMIQFMETYDPKNGQPLSEKNYSKTPRRRVVEYEGRKLAPSVILQDFLMLENQIPLFVLRKVLEFQYAPSEDQVEARLVSMMLNFCKELSPLTLSDNSSVISSSFHLLDFLYQIMTVTISDEDCLCQIVQIQEEDDESDQVLEISRDHPIPHPSIVTTFTIWTHEVFSTLHGHCVTLIEKIKVSRLTKVLTMLSWRIASNLPIFFILKQLFEYLFSTLDNEEPNPESSHMEKPPSIEEITIPSVSELAASGVRFSPADGGLYTTSFDMKTKTIYLPKVNIDLHTEALLRNLVAYEALNVTGPMFITRYTEFMNGIIDTDEDVRLLRENGIIQNRLKSDGEVTDFWNEMSKSIRLTKVDFLDKVIKDVNKYYEDTWRVKAKKLMNLYVFDSWQFLVFLGIMFFLFFMMMQTILLVYKFVRVLGAHIV
uniref:Uncharacterized protein n=1 Tax=Kalanchoe fedtschenkoi TaxID=63787 RepID=A0A7N0VID8_KALFE